MNFIAASILEPERQGITGFRPQDVALGAPGGGQLEATVELVETVGSEQHVRLRLDGAGEPRIIAVVPPDEHVAPDSRVGLRVRDDRLHYFGP